MATFEKLICVLLTFGVSANSYKIILNKPLLKTEHHKAEYNAPHQFTYWTSVNVPTTASKQAYSHSHDYYLIKINNSKCCERSTWSLSTSVSDVMTLQM